MGIRFRKSINIGPLRINFSKSGVGFSIGGKGFRRTRTASGRVRTTLSIPGTGLSHVHESKGLGHRLNKKSTDETIEVDVPKPRNLSHRDGGVVVPIKKNIGLRIGILLLGVLSLGLIYFHWLFSLIFGVSLLLFFMLKPKKIDLTTVIRGSENESQSEINSVKKLFESDAILLDGDDGVLWDQPNALDGYVINDKDNRFVEVYEVPNVIKDHKDMTMYGTNERMVIFLNNNVFIYTEDQVVGFKGTSLSLEINDVSLIQDENPYQNVLVIDTVWEHSNKDGSPDKRYKDNKKMYVCRYKRIDILVQNTSSIRLLSI